MSVALETYPNYCGMAYNWTTMLKVLALYKIHNRSSKAIYELRPFAVLVLPCRCYQHLSQPQEYSLGMTLLLPFKSKTSHSSDLVAL